VRLATGVIGIAGYVLGGLALGAAVLGTWLMSRTLVLHAGVERATGTVVGHREGVTSDGTRVFTPRVRFSTASGTRVEFLGQVTSPVRRFRDGATVAVLYRSAVPETARIDGFVDNHLAPTVALVLALVSAAAAALLVRSAKRDLL
jgi:hypothetical protein